jgi:hypothetical protein
VRTSWTTSVPVRGEPAGTWTLNPELSNIRPFGAVIDAAAISATQAKERAAIEIPRLPRLPTAKELAIQSVAAETRRVNEAIGGLAELVGLQGEIAQRQEAIAAKTGRIVVGLTIALVLFTIVIAVLTAGLLYLTWVLVNGRAWARAYDTAMERRPDHWGPCGRHLRPRDPGWWQP